MTLEILNNFNIEQFQNDLIGWFEKEQRDLPWRKNKDPYRVWVSEIMLQQTRVEAVKPYYANFMGKFPTLEALANADDEEVLKAWEGLGYYSRARNLHAAVKEVKEVYGGIVPSDVKKIEKLKGVGPYTKGAILSIAYGIPEPAVDGNVVREIISAENPSYFNQGLMELGALICIPKNPACLLCPVREHCRGYAEGVQKELPVKSKAKAPTMVPIVAGVLQTEDGRYVINKRPSTGLLANMWEFPNVELGEGIRNQKEQLIDYMKEKFELSISIEEYAMNVQHTFTHRTWDIFVFYGKVTGDIVETDTLKFVSKEAFEQLPFSKSHRTIYENCVEKITMQ